LVHGDDRNLRLFESLNVEKAMAMPRAAAAFAKRKRPKVLPLRLQREITLLGRRREGYQHLDRA
jgi:hypothetical protein